MAWQVLEDRQHAAVLQTLGECAGKCRDLIGPVAKGTIADHRIGPHDRHIGGRHAIDVNSHCREVGSDKAPAKPRRRKPCRAIGIV